MLNAKVVIVNEEDKEISFKDRDLILPSDIYRVSALWVTNSKGEILLAQRAFSKKNNPGKWGPAVAGTIEIGETYDSNIYKEAKEELGIKGIIFFKLDKVKNEETPDRKYFAQWYHAVIDRPVDYFIKQDDEVADVRWFTRDQVLIEIKENPDRFLSSLGKYIDIFKDIK